MDTMLSLEGRQLGNYEVVRRIRAGGMGAVYEGKQRTAFDRRVAIKVILGDYAEDPDMRRRFAREAKTIARLHHPHILQLIEFDEEQGLPYLVMPYIDGGTLTSYLRNSLPDLDEVSTIYQQLLDAVEYAHDAGLIHRDIKSSNVLMEKRRSGTPYVYLADFGLVRNARNTVQVGKDIPLDKVPGTPHYMAPEQTRGIITTSTDIYAMGVLLYQMLTGSLPYRDEDDVRVIQMQLYAPIPSPCEYDASIPTALGEVVRVAMAKRPEDRFKTVAELRTAFLASLKNPTIFVDDEPFIEYDNATFITPRGSSYPVHEDIPAPVAPAIPVAKRDDLAHNPVPLDIPRAPRRRAPRARDEQTAMQVRERPVRLERSAQLHRPRTTETLNAAQRMTDEPVRQKRKMARAPLFMAMIVPAALLILLLMPRILDISFFPSGFPLFGTAPVATVYVTAQSKSFDSRYILTASPETISPDITTHTLPDHVLQASASDVRTVQTTGTQAIAGTQAQGYVLFANNTNKAISLPNMVITSPSGISVQLTQSIQVPPRQDGQSGKASVLAMAVNLGASGNIAAHSLDGVCCGNGVSSSNPDNFYGGADPQNISIVTQTDLNTVQNMLESKLQQQVAQNLQHQLHSDEVMAGKPVYTSSTTASTPVGSPSKQVQVTVNVSGSVTAYSQNSVNQIVTQLVEKEAAQSLALSSGYQQQGTPSVAIASADVHNGSVVYLNVSAHSTWMYVFSLSQIDTLRQNLKGATPTVALAYLNSQQGVAGAQIQLPFNTDRFPTSIDEIKIVLLNPA